jgi:hypothetical protein
MLDPGETVGHAGAADGLEQRIEHPPRAEGLRQMQPPSATRGVRVAFDTVWISELVPVREHPLELPGRQQTGVVDEHRLVSGEALGRRRVAHLAARVDVVA